LNNTTRPNAFNKRGGIKSPRFLKTFVSDNYNIIMWKTISSAEIFKHPRITLIEDDVLLPNGKKIKYLKIKDGQDCAVTIIGKNKKSKILLQKEYSYPPNQKIFQFPGGSVSPGEKPEEGANRELREETGLRAKKLRLLGSYLINNRRSAGKFYVYLGTDLVEDPLPKDETEDLESFWFDENEIEDMIAHGKIINAHVLTAWTLYKINAGKVIASAGRNKSIYK
jgi:8-oxo-dGTP pyrophosphatase MutT (NUDIX family)